MDAGPSVDRKAASSESPEPGPPQALQAPNHLDNDDGEEDSGSDFEQDESAVTDFPISHELPMKDHTKVVSALAIDTSGARFVSGSHDYDCKLWDFGGMGALPKPFKTWEPASTYYVCSCITAIF